MLKDTVMPSRNTMNIFIFRQVGFFFWNSEKYLSFSEAENHSDGIIILSSLVRVNDLKIYVPFNPFVPSVPKNGDASHNACIMSQ